MAVSPPRNIHNVKLQKGTYFYTYVQVYNKTTRTFFIYTDKKNKNKRVVYKDEYATADVTFAIHPVGKGLKDKNLRSYNNKTIKTKYYTDKKHILNACQVNYNHKGREVWTINGEILRTWFK